ncbi:MAG: ParB/RepB/Spo0J family partition protein [Anaerolineales bacterium]|nr:ParB/RepB/Spo0J family partition protein [Anaerolineales bacterium]
MSRKRGLGKGLDALIPIDEEKTIRETSTQEIDPASISPNPRQPRKLFEESDLKELADSIRDHGILQPLIVTENHEGPGYFLIAGERRLQAARMVGLETVPVVLKEADEQQLLAWALVENLQRINLNPLEAAEGYRQLAEEFSLSHEDIAKLVGKNRSTITNTFRLLKLPPAVQNTLREGKISEGHARALLPLPNATSQSAALQTILNKGLNVRQTEELVRRLSGEKKTATSKPGRSPEETDLEDQLRQSLGTKVSLKRSAKGGSIMIHFYSDEELNALLDRLLS